MQLVRKIDLEREALDAAMSDTAGLTWAERAEALQHRARLRDRLAKILNGSVADDLNFYGKRRGKSRL